MRKSREKSGPSYYSGISGIEVLQIIFIVLKLTNVIDAPWWQVFIPTYVNLGIALILILVIVMFNAKHR